jgi:hypothetical protein
MKITDKQRQAIKGIIAVEMEQHCNRICEIIERIQEEMNKKLDKIRKEYVTHIRELINDEVVEEEFDCTISSLFRVLDKGDDEIEHIWNCASEEVIQKWIEEGFK